MPKQRPKMKVDLASKSTTLATWSFEHGESIVQRTVDLPRSVRAAGCAALEFIVSDPASPFSLDISGDGRQLGIALVEVAAETANEH